MSSLVSARRCHSLQHITWHHLPTCRAPCRPLCSDSLWSSGGQYAGSQALLPGRPFLQAGRPSSSRHTRALSSSCCRQACPSTPGSAAWPASLQTACNGSSRCSSSSSESSRHRSKRLVCRNMRAVQAGGTPVLQPQCPHLLASGTRKQSWHGQRHMPAACLGGRTTLFGRRQRFKPAHMRPTLRGALGGQPCSSKQLAELPPCPSAVCSHTGCSRCCNSRVLSTIRLGLRAPLAVMQPLARVNHCLQACQPGRTPQQARRLSALSQRKVHALALERQGSSPRA